MLSAVLYSRTLSRETTLIIVCSFMPISLKVQFSLQICGGIVDDRQHERAFTKLSL